MITPLDTYKQKLKAIVEAGGGSVQFANFMRTPDLVFEPAKLAETQLRLIEALEFYGDRNSWRSPNYDCETKSEIASNDLGCKSFNGENNFADFAIPSGGRRARQALSDIGKGAE